jgi:uncharacterized membrane protein
MSTLILGLIIFLGIHSVSILAPGWRDSMVAKLGELPWKGAYTVISILGFVLMVQGFAQARLEPTVLWAPPAWMRHVAFTLMLPVFPLLLAAYLPGRIKTTTKNPMLVATKLWALAHLLSNGMAHEVLLFGALLAWAVADRLSLKRRPVRATPQLPGSALNDVIVVAGGLALYVGFLLKGHAWLIGVPLVGPAVG